MRTSVGCNCMGTEMSFWRVWDVRTVSLPGIPGRRLLPDAVGVVVAITGLEGGVGWEVGKPYELAIESTSTEA